MGFRLKELRQLWDNLLEIAKANKISHRDVVSKFLKDIEEQYDSKLGFEKKVNEKKGELALINRELNNSRQNLFLNPFLGPTFSNLLQKGIGEQDIININQLIEICISYSFSNNSNEHVSSSISSQNVKDKHIDKRIIIKSRSECWIDLIDELKKYKSIKIAIKKQQESHDKLQRQIHHLDKQKQEILKYLQIAIPFINAINNKFYYLRGFSDQFKGLNYRNNNSSSRLPIPFIFIINNNDIKKDRYKDNIEKGKESQKKEEEEEK
jgi:hypothetical protein